MQAVVKRRGESGAEVSEVEEPEIGDDEVLVRVRASTVCGTDVHIWKWDQWARSRLRPPLVVGHEMAGEVVDTGKNVKSIREGDFVSAETHLVCNRCYQCKTDRKHVCQNTQILGVDTDGVWAEYVAIPEENAWKNDPALDPFLASTQEPLGNAVHSVLPKDNVDDVSGKNVLVTGCGPIGLMSIAVLKEIGASKVFATAGGRNTTRMEMGSEMGADRVFNVREEREEVLPTLDEETDGRGVDVALEMSGAAPALELALKALTPGGRLSMLGFFNSNVLLNFNDLVVSKAAKIFGISGRRAYETWYQVKGLMAKEDFRNKVESILTHKVSMKDVGEGMGYLLNKEGVKLALEPF